MSDMNLMEIPVRDWTSSMTKSSSRWIEINLLWIVLRSSCMAIIEAIGEEGEFYEKLDKYLVKAVSYSKAPSLEARIEGITECCIYITDTIATHCKGCKVCLHVGMLWATDEVVAFSEDVNNNVILPRIELDPIFEETCEMLRMTVKNKLFTV